jgi:hypothetical protein
MPSPSDHPAMEAFNRIERNHGLFEWQDEYIPAKVADAMRDEYEARVKKLEAELEIERGRLAACGVAALGYFDGCQDEYRSASLEDVLKLRSDFDAERGKRCGTCDRKVRGCTLRYLLPEWQDDDFGCTDWEATDE